MPEHRTFKCAEAISIEMLDRLDQHGAVKSPEPGGDVQQRCAQEFDLAVMVDDLIQSNPQAGKRTCAEVNADNTIDGFVSGETDEEIAIAATKIKDRSGAAAMNHLLNGPEAQLMEPPRH